MPERKAEETGGRGLRGRILFALGLLLALAIRLGTLPWVFVGGRALIEGPDGYYHLRRALLTLADWPWTPQIDRLNSVPEGGLITWPPLFDLLLATLALPFASRAEPALEVIGALLPPLLGLIEIALLAWVVRRLYSTRAALWTCLFAALLPGISRYSMAGALDHDPAIEAALLLAMAGVAGIVGGNRRSGGPSTLRAAIEIGLGLAALVLTWAGSVMHLGLILTLLGVITAAPRGREVRSRLARAIGAGALGAAIAVLPFVLGSVWTRELGATFMGLSWLHEAALLTLAAAGLLVALLTGPPGSRRRRRATTVAAIVATLGLLALAPMTLPALIGGLSFLGRKEIFLQTVAESRPLLWLFGELDLRALLVRLSLLPLLYPLLLPRFLRRRASDPRPLLLAVWAVYTLALALVQARYAHAAALPVAALAGVLAAEAASLRRPQLRAAAVALAVLLPSLLAYLPVPGFSSFQLYGRVNYLLTSGMDEACAYLRGAGPEPPAAADPRAPAGESVLAPWSHGHWLHWLARRGTVATPFGPQGQPTFFDGLRFFLLEDPEEARRLLDRHLVRWIVVESRIPPLREYAEMVGEDPARFFETDPVTGEEALSLARYLETLAARLAFLGADTAEAMGKVYPALPGYREVFRSSRVRAGPLGSVPLVRVYEVVR